MPSKKKSQSTITEVVHPLIENHRFAWFTGYLPFLSPQRSIQSCLSSHALFALYFQTSPHGAKAGRSRSNLKIDTGNSQNSPKGEQDAQAQAQRVMSRSRQSFFWSWRSQSFPLSVIGRRRRKISQTSFNHQACSFRRVRVHPDDEGLNGRIWGVPWSKRCMLVLRLESLYNLPTHSPQILRDVRRGEIVAEVK